MQKKPIAPELLASGGFSDLDLSSLLTPKESTRLAIFVAAGTQGSTGAKDSANEKNKPFVVVVPEKPSEA